MLSIILPKSAVPLLLFVSLQVNPKPRQGSIWQVSVISPSQRFCRVFQALGLSDSFRQLPETRNEAMSTMNSVF